MFLHEDRIEKEGLFCEEESSHMNRRSFSSADGTRVEMSVSNTDYNLHDSDETPSSLAPKSIEISFVEKESNVLLDKQLWLCACLTATSLIAFVSALDATSNFNRDFYADTDVDEEADLRDEQNSTNEGVSSEHVYTVVLLLVNLLLSSLLCFCAAGVLVSNKIYNTLSSVLLLTWATACAIVFQSKSGLAIDSFGYVRCANLFFSVWGSMLVALVIFFRGPGCKIRRIVVHRGADSGRLHLWSSLCLMSLVAFISSVNLFKCHCLNYSDTEGMNQRYWKFPWDEEELCAGTKIGAIVGLIGFIFSALHILNIGILCGKDGILDERKILLFLQTTFCLGTYATTFSDGPGKTFGNLYCAIWLANLLCLKILIQAFFDEAKAIDSNEKGSTAGEHFKNILKGSRLLKWISLTVFSLVGFCSAIDSAHNYGGWNNVDENSDASLSNGERYTIIALLSAFIFSFATVTMHFFPKPATFSIIEKWQSLLLLSILLINIMTINHSEKSLAVDGKGQVFCMNLFVFAWGSLILTFQIFGSCTGHHDVADLDPLMIRRFFWFVTLKASIVIAVGADHIWNYIGESCSADERTTLCSRTKLSRIVGIAGLILCTVGVFANMMSKSTNDYFSRVEGSSVLLLIFNNFVGVIFITSTNGPGETIGNMYFFTWLSFAISIACGTFYKIQLGGEMKDNLMEVKIGSHQELHDIV